MDQEKQPRNFTLIRKKCPYPPPTTEESYDEDEEEDSGPVDVYRNCTMTYFLRTCVTIPRVGANRAVTEAGNKTLRLMKNCTPANRGTMRFNQLYLWEQVIAGNDETSDITVKFANSTMHLHWNILLFCPYFRSVFRSGNFWSVFKSETARHTGEIQMPYTNEEAMWAAIQFIYTGAVDVTMDNLKELLEVADYLQLQEMRESISDSMWNLPLTVDSCVLLLLLSAQYNMPSYDTVAEFFKGHLLEAMEDEMMLNVMTDSVLELLHDKTLSYVPMSEFFNFIVWWTRHDLEGRSCFFEDLFMELDMSKMEHTFIEETVSTCDLVVASEKCKRRLSAMKVMRPLGNPGCLMEDVVLVAGGKHDGFLRRTSFPEFDLVQSSVYGYVINENRWTSLAPLPRKMEHPRMTFSPNSSSLFVFDGGKDILHPESTLPLYKYDAAENTWTNVMVAFPDTDASTHIHSIHSCNGTLWIVATDNFDNETTNTEQGLVSLYEMAENDDHCTLRFRLFPVTSTTKIQSIVVNDQYVCVTGSDWKKCPRDANATYKRVRVHYMNARKRETYNISMGAEFDQMVYADGICLVTADFDGAAMKIFNFETRKWTALWETIPFPNHHAGQKDYISVVVNRNVYMMGGRRFSSGFHTNHAFRYDLDKMCWEAMPDLPRALINSGAAAVRIPAALVSCHQECPHCIFVPKHLQAKYNCQDGSIGRRDQEGDEDEEPESEQMEIYVTREWEAELS